MLEMMIFAGVTGYKECEPQRPGFNTVCADGNHARWGYCVNIPSQACQAADTDDADGVMGFGLEVRKNDEFCVKNEEFCTENDELCRARTAARWAPGGPTIS